MNVIRPSIFPPSVIAAFSTRNGGVSRPPLGMNLSFNVGDEPDRVRANRAIFFGGLGLSLERLALPGQVHGTTVKIVAAPGDFPATDGLITNVPGVYLCISIADCVPLLLYDPVCRLIGAVHAGWRGTADRIAAVAVGAMVEHFGVTPANLLAHIGPSASSCCYAVGKEVAVRFPGQVIRDRSGGPFIDLKGANRDQLLNAGLLPERIETSPYCTISDSTLFHSHRREGLRSGRMMGVIGLTA